LKEDDPGADRVMRGSGESATRECSVLDSDSLRRALNALRSLRDGDRGVAQAASCGGAAIPALRQLLFERDPSGFFETRRRTVKALALIGARDVLIEFLESSREITDPVERLGEDAIINAAARALADASDPRVFHLLTSLAAKKTIPGIVAALGAFRRAEAIPHLVAALAEDESRGAAEAALVDDNLTQTSSSSRVTSQWKSRVKSRRKSTSRSS
jgi:HEAT repeat protein